MFGAWKRAVAGGALLALAAFWPVPPAAAAGADPGINLGSVSYSGQSRPFRVSIKNNVAGARVEARISNSPNFGDTSMSCSGSGTGTWTCTAPNRILSPGSLTIRAQSVDASDPSNSSRVVSRSASVTSSFSVSGPGGSVTAGEGFSVSGSYDHLSGTSDYAVTARVTRNGSVVAGQSSVGCSTSGTSYRCSLRSAAAGSYSIQVTETSRLTGHSSSASTSARVTAPDPEPTPDPEAPAAPSFSLPSSMERNDQTLTVTGTAERSGLRIEFAVDTTSFASPATSCTSGSGGAFFCTLPQAFTLGSHTVYARAIDPAAPDKPSLIASQQVSITKPERKPKPTKKPTPTPTATPTPAPTPTAEPDPVAGPAAPVSSDGGPSDDTDALIMLLLLGLSIAALSRPGALALARTGSSGSFTEPDPSLVPPPPTERVGPGDQSGWWGFLGHEVTDEWSRTAPAAVSRRSPWLARLAADGAEIRAMFGALWWLLPIAGAALGIMAASDTSFEATAPSAGLVVGVLAISALDAFSGLVAAAFFAVLVSGDLSARGGHGALAVLALALWWTALPLFATAVRTLRRARADSRLAWWDRAADVVIIAVLAGWFSALMAGSFDVLAGRETGLPDDAATIGLIAALLLAARALISQGATLWWPERLRFTEGDGTLPPPSSTAIVAGAVVRIALFAFAGHVLVGTCWQWWAGVALFALPDLLALADVTFGWKWSHKGRVPTGLTAIVAAVIAGALLTMAAVSGAASDAEALRWAFAAVGVFPAVLGIAETFDGSERKVASTWRLQIAGIVVVGIAIGLAAVGWNF